MKKHQFTRILSAALACMLLLALLPASALASGWESHWSAGSVKTALDYGWIEADENGNIPAGDAMTRGDFAVLLWRALGSPDAQDCPFTDVEGEVKTAVAALYAKGVVTGASSTAFLPNNTLTRQEGITMVARAFGKTSPSQSTAAYADWADVDSWAQGSVAAMTEAGFVNGVGGNALAPKQNITLGEMCKMTAAVFDASAPAQKISADDAIKAVTTLGFVDMDGSKTYAIVVEYNIDLTGADLGVNAFDVDDYGLTVAENSLDTGSDPGKPLKAYVNSEPATSENGGSGTGKYVIIEVNTEFSVNRFPRSYKVTMFADVAQAVAVRTNDYLITPSTKGVGNYEEFEYIGINPQTGGFRDPEYYNYALDGTYTIEGIEGYELHTIASDYDNGYGDARAFQATHCFDEANGQYWDFELPYAIYVPEDYDASKEYALVLHIHDAGSMSTDPMLTLTEAQGPNNYASEYFQNLAKEQGLGGAIVVCPAITEMFYMNEENPAYELRISRDNWTLSCGAPAVWKLVDSIVEEYSIDTNRIYGSGQSMGGMTVMAMAAQRDNYFAAILPMSCKWGTNFNKDVEFDGSVYYNAPADDEVIWSKDSDGNPVDYNNWFYLISDDNVLYLNTEGENAEYMILYSDLCGVTVEQSLMYLDAETNTTVEERNAIVNELVNRDSQLGIYQVTLDGTVGHMSAWFYGHSTNACYEWLLNQTRDTEMAREKLDLNKPFVRAAEQIQTPDRVYSTDRNDPSNVTYYVTGEFGSGTQGYNSATSKLGSQASQPPGWTAEDYE